MFPLSQPRLGRGPCWAIPEHLVCVLGACACVFPGVHGVVWTATPVNLPPALCSLRVLF